MVETAATLNIIGLIFDIIGATLIFKFGLPEILNREGRDFITVEQVDENEVAKAERYDRWGRLGLGLLIFGFTTQVVGNSTVFWA